MAISTIGSDGLATGAVTSTKLTSGVPTRAQLPAGTVLQVVSTTKTDTFSTTANSFTGITGLSLSITPTSSSSKILLVGSINIGRSASINVGLRFTRNGTGIGIGDAAGSRTQATTASYTGNADSASTNQSSSMLYLDSPATTSATTYAVQIRSQSGGYTAYVNLSGADSDGADYYRTASTLTLMEIAA